jgi:2-dehydropantoate 2-reductase
MNRISLVGPGAIGGLVAAWLCQDDRNQVTVCARTPLRRLSLETPWGLLEAEPEVLLSPTDALTPADWILVATKAYDSAAAAAWFPGLLGDDTRLAVLQNGVDHVDRFKPFLAEERIVPAVVDCPTERTAPGMIQQRGDATIKVPRSEAGAAFCALFGRTRIDASQEADFPEVAWRKLCINAAGAVNALAGLPAGLSKDPDGASLMRAIVEETVSVGRAEGVTLPDGMADDVIATYRAQPADSVNSLLADRLADRPMETDARNGVIVRLGRKHGVPTPYNDMAVRLLDIAARGTGTVAASRAGPE